MFSNTKVGWVNPDVTGNLFPMHFVSVGMIGLWGFKGAENPMFSRHIYCLRAVLGSLAVNTWLQYVWIHFLYPEKQCLTRTAQSEHNVSPIATFEGVAN